MTIKVLRCRVTCDARGCESEFNLNNLAEHEEDLWREDEQNAFDLFVMKEGSRMREVVRDFLPSQGWITTIDHDYCSEICRSTGGMRTLRYRGGIKAATPSARRHHLNKRGKRKRRKRR